jgi:hypothetical protein
VTGLRRPALRRGLAAAGVLVVVAGLWTGPAGLRPPPAGRAAAAQLVAPGTAAVASGNGPGTSRNRPSPPGTLPASAPHPSLRVLRQDPYVVGPRGTWTIDLSIPRASSARLQVAIYPRLYTRTAFRQSLGGTFNSYASYWSGSLQASSLPPAPGGGVELRLPINPAKPPPAGYLPAAYLSQTSFGVYPVQISLINDQGGTTGLPVTTYLIWVPGPTGLPKLAVSWIVPVTAGTAREATGYNHLTRRQEAAVSSEVAALGSHPTVGLSLALSPQLAAALSTSGAGGRAILDALSGIASNPSHQLMPATYVPVDLPALAAAGLNREIADQLTAGTAALRTLLHVNPAGDTWAVNGPIDTAVVSQLKARGATRLVIPDSTLAAYSYAYTFAQPVMLRSNPGVEVVGADTGLQSHFTNGGDQVLQGEQLLAELAMIDSETPGETRGVAILAPGGWTPQPAFINTVLGGLQGNPLLQAVTADQLFSSVPPATSGGQSLARGLATSHATPFPDASSIRQLRRDMAALAVTYPGATATRNAMDQRLLSAESSALSPGARATAMGAVRQAMARALGQVNLPPAISLTLTARNGSLPITVIDRGALPARVTLELTSDKLNFRPFRPPAGACRSSATAVVCRLRLTTPVTTLKVPVQTRTTGVFSLDLALKAPGGSVVLNQARYTVRSTAVSVVAIVLMVGAGLLLIMWWIRDRRHGKRAPELVTPPEEQAPSDADTPGTAGAGGPAASGVTGPPGDDVDEAPADGALAAHGTPATNGDGAAAGDGDSSPREGVGRPAGEGSPAGERSPGGGDGSPADEGDGPSGGNGHDAGDSRRRWEPPPVRRRELPGAGRRR